MRYRAVDVVFYEPSGDNGFAARLRALYTRSGVAAALVRSDTEAAKALAEGPFENAVVLKAACDRHLSPADAAGAMEGIDALLRKTAPPDTRAVVLFADPRVLADPLFRPGQPLAWGEARVGPVLPPPSNNDVLAYYVTKAGAREALDGVRRDPRWKRAMLRSSPDAHFRSHLFATRDTGKVLIWRGKVPSRVAPRRRPPVDGGENLGAWVALIFALCTLGVLLVRAFSF